MPSSNRDEIRLLLRPVEGPCASIYLPAHPIGDGPLEDVVRLKNQLRTAEQGLQSAGLSDRDAAAALAPCRRLLDKDQELYWRQPGNGMCLFASRAGAQIHRLPMPVAELVHVGPSFLLRPLLPLLAVDAQFHILVLSIGQVRLLIGDRDGAHELDVSALPGFLDVVGRDFEQKTLQAHSATGAGLKLHGHGEGRDDRKSEMDKYLKSVDEGLRSLRATGLPVLLAGVERVQSMFRQLTKHPQVLPQGIAGNAERMSPRELHERAWALIAPKFRATTQQALERVQASLGTGLASVDPREIVRAGRQGKIGLLLLDEQAELWGRVGDDGVEEHPQRQNGDLDLLDDAAVTTLRHGGTVLLARQQELPRNAKLAALLRQ